MRIEILAFHRILDPGDKYFIPPMAFSRKDFSRLIDKLSRSYQILAMSEAVTGLKNRSLLKRSLCLTFDDGYLDNFELAEDFLKRRGIPATFFLPVHQIDSSIPYWWDYLDWAARRFRQKFQSWLERSSDGLPAGILRGNTDPISVLDLTRSIVRILNGLPKQRRQQFITSLENRFGPYDGPRLLMSWDEVRYLCRNGFEIGSHTLSHEPLTDLDESKAFAEIEESKTALTERIGQEISGFCYPRGAHSLPLARCVQRAGYAYAVTTCYGSNIPGQDAFMLRRRNIADYQGWRKSFPVFASRIEISGILDPLLSRRRSG